MTKPNILLIMTDQLRWDYVGYADRHAVETPTLDRLAAESVVFDHCYTPNPLCMPARCALHTGLYTFQSGQMNNIGDWPMHYPTFTQALRSMGYRTALMGKIHAHEAIGQDIDLTEDPWGAEIHDLGFDDVCQVSGKSMAFFTDDAYTNYLRELGLLHTYREDLLARTEAGREGPVPSWPSILPEEHYVDRFIADRATEWLAAYDKERPFFLMASFCSPHTPFDAYASAFEGLDVSDQVEPVACEHPERYTGAVTNYVAQMRIVDDGIARLLEVLRQREWLEDTVIVFTADHGEMLGDLDKASKCWWEDPSTRVPLLIRYPGHAAPRTVHETMVSMHDVAATLVDIAAGEAVADEMLPGSSSISLVPFLTGEAEAVRGVVYSENGGQFMVPWRMVDNSRYKYVWRLDTDERLLFDLTVDPHCTVNVADQPEMRAVVAEMEREMLRIHIENPTPKTGRAAFTVLMPHRITRERLDMLARQS